MKNLKKVIALALTFAVAITTASSTVADAAITNDNTDGNGYYVKLRDKSVFGKEDAFKYDEVYGITFYLDRSKFEKDVYPNGAIGPNAKSTGWATIEFAAEGKEIKLKTSDCSVTYLDTKPVFNKDDFTKEDFYAEFLVVDYGSPADWGVKDWAILGKGGKKLWTMSGGDQRGGSSNSGSGSTGGTTGGKLPQTGVVSTSVFVGIGATLIGAGVGLRKKREDEE